MKLGIAHIPQTIIRLAKPGFFFLSIILCLCANPSTIKAQIVYTSNLDTNVTTGFDNPVGQSCTITGLIYGTGLFTFNAGSPIALANSNTYSGGSILNTGTLILGNNQALGVGPLFMETATILQAGIADLSVTNNVFLDGNVSFNANGYSTTLFGNVSGVGGFAVTNTSGTLGSLTLLGVTTGGSVTLSTASNLSVSSANLSAIGRAGPILGGNASVSIGSDLTVNDGSQFNVVGGLGLDGVSGDDGGDGGTASLWVTGAVSVVSGETSITGGGGGNGTTGNGGNGGNATVVLGSLWMENGSVSVTGGNSGTGLAEGKDGDVSVSLGAASLTDSSLDVVSGDIGVGSSGSAALTVANELSVDNGYVNLLGGTASAFVGSLTAANNTQVVAIGVEGSASLVASGSISVANSIVGAVALGSTGDASISIGSDLTVLDQSEFVVEGLADSASLAVGGAVSVDQSQILVLASVGTAFVSIGSLTMTNGSEVAVLGESAVLATSGPVSVDDGVIGVWGNSGSDNSSGDAGFGGNASVFVGTDLILDNSSALHLVGGKGGNSEDGLGGAGGSANLTVAGLWSLDNSTANVVGGNAGYGYGLDGTVEEKGGNAWVSLGGLTLTSGSALSVLGGVGGEDEYSEDLDAVGGDGGSASLAVAGTALLDDSSLKINGGMGSASQNADGGKGGDAYAFIGNNLTLVNDSDLTMMGADAGKGSFSGYSGVGGAGGSATLVVAGAVSLDDFSEVSVTAGGANTGWGLSGTTGGKGGNTSVSIASSLTVNNGSSLELFGGAGSEDDNFASGGDGGAALLTVTGKVSLDASDLHMFGGSGGMSDGAYSGNGGEAEASIGLDLSIRNGSEFTLTGGGSGPSYETGAGNGNSAVLAVAGSVSVDASGLYVFGGSGGYSDGSYGGHGGDATVSIGSGLTIDNGSQLFVKAGSGGDSYDSDGGNGGNASVSIGSLTLIGNSASTTLILKAGAGGDAGDGGIGNGGTGGSASLFAGAVTIGSYSVTVSGGIGGSSVAANGGDGGDAFVSLGSASISQGSIYVMAGEGGSGAAVSTGIIYTMAGVVSADAVSTGISGKGGNASVSVGTTWLEDGSTIAAECLGGGNAFANFGAVTLNNRSEIGAVVSGSGNASVTVGSALLDNGANIVSADLAGQSASLSVGTASLDHGSAILAESIFGGNVTASIGSVSLDNGSSFGAESFLGENASVTIAAATLDNGSSIMVGVLGDGNSAEAALSIGSASLNHGSSITITAENGGEMGSNVFTSIGSLSLIDDASFLDVEAGTNGEVHNGKASVSLGGLYGLGSVTVTGGPESTLQVASGDFSGSINGAIGLEKVGGEGDTLFLRGTNNYTGATTVTGGVLVVDTDGTMGTSHWVTVGTAGTLAFINSADASPVTDETSLTIENAGLLVFKDSSTAASVTVTDEGGSWTIFLGDAQGGHSVFDLRSGTKVTEVDDLSVTQVVNSYFDISGATSGVTVGSMDDYEGSGVIYLGSKNLGLGSNNTDMMLSSSIQDGGVYDGVGGSLTKLGVDSTLYLSGINSYSGGTYLEEGYLVVANTRALGLGNVTVDGGDLSTDGRNHVILVGKNYTQSSAATLSLSLGGTGYRPNDQEGRLLSTDYDRLLVVGMATLSGTLDLGSKSYEPGVADTARPYPTYTSPTIGKSFVVISTGAGLSGQFTTITDPYTDVRLYPVYMPYEMLLETMPISFKNLGTTFNEKSVATNLDNLYESQAVTGLLAQLGTLQAGDYAHAYDQIAPSSLTSMYTVNFRIAQMQATALGTRMSSFLAGQGGFGARNEYAGIDSGIQFAGALPAEEELEMSRHSSRIKDEERWGGFIIGDGGNLKVTGDGNGDGYKAKFGGLTAAGVDYQANRDLAIGLLLGDQEASVNAEGGSHLAINGGQIGLYALAKSKGFYAQALGEGGYDIYDGQRVSFGGTASSHTKGSMYAGQMGLGYRMQTAHLTYGPMGSIQYTAVNVKAFQETGSLSPESFGKQQDHSLASNLGARVAANLPVGKNATFYPVVSVGWVKEYHNNGGTINANLAGSPFTVEGAQIGQNGFQMDGGLGLQWRNGMNLSVHYEKTLGRKHYDSQTVGGEIHVYL
jgi:uncharacterized protein YhjY with autotransporter beta-barrel domain